MYDYGELNNAYIFHVAWTESRKYPFNRKDAHTLVAC